MEPSIIVDPTPKKCCSEAPKPRVQEKATTFVGAAITTAMTIPRKRKQDEILDHESEGDPRKAQHIDQAFTASKPNINAPKSIDPNPARVYCHDSIEAASNGPGPGSTSTLRSLSSSALDPALRDSDRVVEDDISLPDDDDALSDIPPSSPLCPSEGAEYDMSDAEVLALIEAASTIPFRNLFVSADITASKVQAPPQQDMGAHAGVTRHPAGVEEDSGEMSTTEFGEDFLSDGIINLDFSAEHSNWPLAKLYICEEGAEFATIAHRGAERSYNTKTSTGLLPTPGEPIKGFMSKYEESFFENDDEDADNADQKQVNTPKMAERQCVPGLLLKARDLNEGPAKVMALTLPSLGPPTPEASKAPYSQIGLAPILRTTFPGLVSDRSPVVGLSSETFLRTCFRVGEALNIASHFVPAGKNAIIELYARVMSSHREDGTGKQHFAIRDIFHDNAPHLDGVYDGWKGVGLWDDDSSVFLDRKDGGRLCRCIGRMRREGKKWMIVMMNIWEAGWDDVEHVRGIVSAQSG